MKKSEWKNKSGWKNKSEWMKKSRVWAAALFLSLSFVLSSCSGLPEGDGFSSDIREEISSDGISAWEEPGKFPEAETEPVPAKTDEEAAKESTGETAEKAMEESMAEASGERQPDEALSPEKIEEIVHSFETSFPEGDIVYSGSPYMILNANIPFFAKDNLPTESFEYYSGLDDLGRCGIACANIGQDIMPVEERGNIGQIKPSGWHTVKYDIVNGNYLYNRCHLIAYELSAENANEENLITGTRYMNVEGMLPFENQVADYVKETGNHVLYRVAPVYAHEDDLLAYGVVMEGWSVEDGGEGICYNVFVFNVQPGIAIDYATGESCLAETEALPDSAGEDSQIPESSPDPEDGTSRDAEEAKESQADAPRGTTYILNTNTKKFHYPDCSSVKQMAEKNKQEYTGNRDDVISMGYDACKRCKP